jgi:hypothetical protein
MNCSVVLSLVVVVVQVLIISIFSSTNTNEAELTMMIGAEGVGSRVIGAEIRFLKLKFSYY